MLTAAFVDPVAFHIGPISVRWYGLIFVTAIFSAIWLTMKAAERRGLNPDIVPDLAMLIVPAGVIGARLYEVFVLQWPHYRQHPLEILAVWEGGLAIHGGVILAIACGAIYAWRKKLPFWTWADMIAPGLILAQAIGRWGNFFNQEAYGSAAPEGLIRLMPGWLKTGMTIDGTVYHPTFLYESVWNFAVFALLLWLERRKPTSGTVISLYFILYNVGRLIIESIRMDSSFIGGLRVAQLMAIAQIVVGVGLLVWRLQRKRPSAAL